MHFNFVMNFHFQMEREMEELKRQRDIAQSQLELERKVHKVHKVHDGYSFICLFIFYFIHQFI